MRRSARIDANQPAVVEFFRKAGCSVAITSALGGGFPDLVVAKRGLTIVVEVKDGSRKPSEQRLTEDEERFFGAWLGHWYVVRSIEDAGRALAYLNFGGGVD